MRIILTALAVALIYGPLTFVLVSMVEHWRVMPTLADVASLLR